jgi:hypothetical protein
MKNAGGLVKIHPIEAEISSSQLGSLRVVANQQLRAGASHRAPSKAPQMIALASSHSNHRMGVIWRCQRSPEHWDILQGLPKTNNDFAPPSHLLNKRGMDTHLMAS